MELFSSQVCGATSLCLLMTATRTRGCRQSVAIRSIPSVPQIGGLCFEVTVNDMVDEAVGSPGKAPFRECKGSPRSASAAGRPSAMREQLSFRVCGLDGCRGTRAARVRAEYPSQRWITVA